MQPAPGVVVQTRRNSQPRLQQNYEKGMAPCGEVLQERCGVVVYVGCCVNCVSPSGSTCVVGRAGGLEKYKQPEINCSAQPVASAIFLDASLTAFWLLYETFLSRDEFRIVTVFFV